AQFRENFRFRIETARRLRVVRVMAGNQLPPRPADEPGALLLLAHVIQLFREEYFRAAPAAVRSLSTMRPAQPESRRYSPAISASSRDNRRIHVPFVMLRWTVRPMLSAAARAFVGMAMSTRSDMSISPVRRLRWSRRAEPRPRRRAPAEFTAATSE